MEFNKLEYECKGCWPCSGLTTTAAVMTNLLTILSVSTQQHIQAQGLFYYCPVLRGTSVFCYPTFSSQPASITSRLAHEKGHFWAGFNGMLAFIAPHQHELLTSLHCIRRLHPVMGEIILARNKSSFCQRISITLSLLAFTHWKSVLLINWVFTLSMHHLAIGFPAISSCWS